MASMSSGDSRPSASGDCPRPLLREFHVGLGGVDPWLVEGWITGVVKDLIDSSTGHHVTGEAYREARSLFVTHVVLSRLQRAIRKGRQRTGRSTGSPDAEPPGSSTVRDMRVAVRAHTEILSRAATALAAHPAIDQIGLIGRRPGRAWRSRMIEIDDAEGFEVALGVDHRAEARGAVLVTPADAPDDGPTVTWADPTGLARALAGPDRTPARTINGSQVRSGTRLAFPAPVGYLHARETRQGVLLAPVEGRVAGVLAIAEDGSSRAAIDDIHFLHAVCLAAGVLLAPAAIDGPRPVWDQASDYLDACRSFGLVTAESEA
jgi:hypothetical protein